MPPVRRRAPRRRGRPPKYGQPARVVAATLPQDTIEALANVHSDLGWAIVRVVDKAMRRTSRQRTAAEDVSLVEIGGGQALIVVDPTLVRGWPGVQVVPLSDRQAFLALAPGQGMADLELAVHDHLDALRAGTAEHAAAERLLARLRSWRRDSDLAFESRVIILATSKRSRRRL
jgi:hypothetical protein